MVKILDYLYDKKMITREMNSDDRRERIIKLTEKSKKILSQIQKGVEEMNKTALKGFTDKEQTLFKQFLERASLNLKNLPVNTVDIKIKK